MYGTEHRYAPRRIRILHVDDDRAFLDVTESFLTRELPSAEIATVQHPDAAIERLRAESFDCVISDYEMPDTDGLELLSQVRDWSDDLPFLLYTGKGSESIASRAINAGGTGYLQKGGSEQHERLANRVEHAVREYHAGLDTERYSAVPRSCRHGVSHVRRRRRRRRPVRVRRRRATHRGRRPRRLRDVTSGDRTPNDTAL